MSVHAEQQEKERQLAEEDKMPSKIRIRIFVKMRETLSNFIPTEEESLCKQSYVI